MKKTTIWLSEADIELRDELAAQLGRSASEIVRLGLHVTGDVSSEVAFRSLAIGLRS